MKVNNTKTSKEKKEKILFLNKLRKKDKNKINLNLKTKNGRSFIRTPPKKRINNFQNEIIISRLNNTIH